MSTFKIFILTITLLSSFNVHAGKLCLSYFKNYEKNLISFNINESQLRTVVKFWNHINSRNSRSTTNPAGLFEFNHILSHIFKILETQSSIDLERPLNKLTRSKGRAYATATVLYLLSTTPTGQKIISENLSYINGRSFKESDFIQFLYKKMSDQGLFDYSSKYESTAIYLNRDLNLGVAVLFMAHELTHLINAAKIGIEHVFETHRASAMDEALAYSNQTIVSRELLHYPEFENYRIKYEDKPSQAFVGFSKKSLIEHLVTIHKLPKKEVNLAVHMIGQTLNR